MLRGTIWHLRSTFAALFELRGLKFSSDSWMSQSPSAFLLVCDCSQAGGADHVHGAEQSARGAKSLGTNGSVPPPRAS